MINLNKIANKIATNDLLTTIVPKMTFDEHGNKEWKLNGVFHREDGPAIERANGGKEWWINGKLHRENGPAIEHANGTKQWWINGKHHREDGPAAEYADGGKLWYLNGVRIEYDPETWDQKVQESHVENLMSE